MTRIEKYNWLKAWFNDHREAMKNQPSMVSLIRANATARKYIHELYFALLNKTLQGCSQCEADALLFLMMKKTEETMKKIVDCRFKLKHGVLLQGVKGLPMVTCANLTDELAIAYLKDNPNRAKMFDVIPDGWDADTESAETAQFAPEETEELQDSANEDKSEQNENNAENSAEKVEETATENVEQPKKRGRKPKNA